MINFKMWVLISIIACVSTMVAADSDMTCERFVSIMKDVENVVRSNNRRDEDLIEAGFVFNDTVFGADPTYDDCSQYKEKYSELHIVGAQLFLDEYNVTVTQFQDLVVKCGALKEIPYTCTRKPRTLPKYRPIDGRGNNINKPEWGSSDTPFARFGPKGYADGIYTVKKSVTGCDLPNPRYLVQEVLRKTCKSNPPPLSYGVFALLTVLFITHDVHYQTPTQPTNPEQEILCCTADGHDSLPNTLSHSACLPIEIPTNDSYYAPKNVGCINFVRSQTSEYSYQVQPGEIMNRATSYLDLSLIYGNHESELEQIRSYECGKFRMGPNNVLPVDVNGNYIPSMKRFTMAPMASIWPSLFVRNHNNIATRLAALNPQWDDETLFQEARRINIATFQYNLITSKAVEASISNIPINENYDPNRNAATTLEFAIAYRSAHYYLLAYMLFKYENNQTTQIMQSDTIGKIYLLENNFDAALRGALSQVVNVGQYSEELTNNIGKYDSGYGKDIIAIDIQRGRDQGLPSYLAVRRLCNLKPPVESFDDLEKVFDKRNVDLLRKAYASVEDIDYYVGGMCETFNILGNPLVGPTFGCVIARQWDNFAGGDIYYYSNPTSPYPFTQDQIYAIRNYSISNLLCANSGMKDTAKVWPYAPNPNVNPEVSCDTFPPMNLSAWKVRN